MRVCCVDLYLGLPNIVTDEASKQFMANVFLSNAALMKIETKSAPIES